MSIPRAPKKPSIFIKTHDRVVKESVYERATEIAEEINSHKSEIEKLSDQSLNKLRPWAIVASDYLGSPVINLHYVEFKKDEKGQVVCNPHQDIYALTTAGWKMYAGPDFRELRRDHEHKIIPNKQISAKEVEKLIPQLEGLGLPAFHMQLPQSKEPVSPETIFANFTDIDLKIREQEQKMDSPSLSTAGKFIKNSYEFFDDKTDSSVFLAIRGQSLLSDAQRFRPLWAMSTQPKDSPHPLINVHYCVKRDNKVETRTMVLALTAKDKQWKIYDKADIPQLIKSGYLYAGKLTQQDYAGCVNLLHKCGFNPDNLIKPTKHELKIDERYAPLAGTKEGLKKKIKPGKKADKKPVELKEEKKASPVLGSASLSEESRRVREDDSRVINSEDLPRSRRSGSRF